MACHVRRLLDSKYNGFSFSLKVSEVKFKALMKAMTNTDRIAIIRRVYRKDSRVTIGTLIPDDDRQVCNCTLFI